METNMKNETDHGNQLSRLRIADIGISSAADIPRKNSPENSTIRSIKELRTKTIGKTHSSGKSISQGAFPRSAIKTNVRARIENHNIDEINGLYCFDITSLSISKLIILPHLEAAQ